MFINNQLQQLIQRGSATAKNGFSNEKDVANKFNNWVDDADAQNWLAIMGYQLKHIKKVEATRISGGHKTDVQVVIRIYFKNGLGIENISIKLVTNQNGFNQIDKRWVDKYAELWNIPADIVLLLKEFTGEITPRIPSTRDDRRIFLNELPTIEQAKIVSFFKDNKIAIITDIFQGRDEFPAMWMLIYQKYSKAWTLLPIALVMNYYGNGLVQITNQGSLKIGRVGMQRKGGDNGRDSAKMLQFKINPCDIVNYKIYGQSDTAKTQSDNEPHMQ